MLVDSGASVAAALLAWYDGHARVLPWRAPPGTRADPYRVWLSEIMLQQTTVAAATPYFRRFTEAWPTVQALAAADEAAVMAAWAGLGYYARARNLIACAKAVRAAGGEFPANEAALRALPGIGAYTAAAIAAIAFGVDAVPVDANVERVVARLFAIPTPLPAARPAIAAAARSILYAGRAGDWAQAMMDLGATLCLPRQPRCLLCPLRAQCAAYRTGEPERFPVKPPKASKPVRRGTLFWLTRGDRVLLVRRPATGLLGGMRALPTGPWAADDPRLAGAPVADADWRLRGGGRHVFTHFALDWQVAAASAGRADAPAGEWWPIATIGAAGLPTLFARAAARAVATDGETDA